MLKPEQRFNRWDWVEFSARNPTSDSRFESRHVFEDTITIAGQLRDQDRSRLIDRALRPSVADAMERGESFCVLRPTTFRMTWKERSSTEIAAEREKRARRLKQGSLLDEQLDELEPCPFKFLTRFEAGGTLHNCQCGDWETDAMFWRLSREYGREAALSRMEEVFNSEYPKRGMAIAMGTMASKPKTWILLAIIRADILNQADLF